MGVLERWDRHNQGVTNWLHDHPEAGTRSFPRAVSPRARVILAVAYVLCIVGGTILGFGAWVVGAGLFLVAWWRLQSHPGRDGYGLDDAGTGGSDRSAPDGPDRVAQPRVGRRRRDVRPRT